MAASSRFVPRGLARAATWSGGSHPRHAQRPGRTPYNRNFDFSYPLNGQMRAMTMTSVSGHLSHLDFAAPFNGWRSCAPLDLFDAPLTRSFPGVRG
jgi:hypothetical protein